MTHRNIALWLKLTLLPLIILSYLYIDIPVGRWAIAHDGTLIDNISVIVGYFGESVYILVVSALLWIVWRYIKVNRSLALKSQFVFFSVVITGIGVNIIKLVFGKSRPTMLKSDDEFGFQWFAAIGDHSHVSFPSGHATTAFTLATALTLMFPRWWPAFYSYAVAISLARVGAWDHYPSDVLAGALFGTLVTLWLYHQERTTFHKKRVTN